MDPNANLREQLELALDIVRAETPAPDDAVRLAELVLAMDAWLRGGPRTAPSRSRRGQ